MRVVAASVGWMIDCGPMSQPTRQPVAAHVSAQNEDESGVVSGMFRDSGERKIAYCMQRKM